MTLGNRQQIFLKMFFIYQPLKQMKTQVRYGVLKPMKEINNKT